MDVEPWSVGLRLFAVTLGFPAVVLAIGYASLHRADWLDRKERFAAAWGVGFATLAASQFLAFLTGIDPRVWHPIFLTLAFVGAWVKGRFLLPIRGRTIEESPRPCGALWLLMPVHLLCIQSQLLAYIGGGWAFDWWMHYEKARVFLGHLPVTTTWVEKYTIASRTPLMNLTLASVLSVAGDAFWTYQWASAFTNSVVVLPLALLAGRLAGTRGERLVYLLAPLNLWVLHEGWFTWTKMLACYYLLMSLHFYLRWRETREADPAAAWRRFLAFWAASLLAFLTHQITLVYTLALAVHAVVSDPKGFAWLLAPRRFFTLLGSAVATLAPWYAWLWKAVGPSKIVAAVPTTVVLADHAAESRWKVVTVYAYSTATTFVPHRLIAALALEPFSAGAVVIHLMALYFCQVPGALTLSLCLYLLIVLFKRCDHVASQDRAAVWTFAGLGGLLATLLTPYESRYGLAHNSLVATTFALLVLAWGALARGTGWLPRLACLGIAAEFLGMFWGHLAWVVYYRDTGRIGTDLNWEVQHRYGLVFLNDVLGPALPYLFGACVVTQVILLRLLIEWTRGAKAEGSS